MASKIKQFLTFVDTSIWRVRETEMTGKKRVGYRMLKVVTQSCKHYFRDRVQMRAKALTYSTMISLVPILALLFAIARGFGFANLLESLIRKGIAVGNTLDTVMNFIDSYLEHTHSGIFIGVGLIVLLWSIITLTSNIEQSMNAIWGIKKPRGMFRKITDYFSMFLLLPIFIICIAGWSIFMTTVYQSLTGQILLSTFVRFLIKAAPYLLSGLIFTGMFIFFPNTKVSFRHAIIPGMVTGAVFQLFFYFYISVQMNISSYNAIYGSFAIIPLLMLFLNIFWCIILFGVQLTYVSQNIEQYSFNDDVQNVSKRFKDFTAMLLMSHICKQFESGEKSIPENARPEFVSAAQQPYSMAELSAATDIPLRLVQQTIDQLEKSKLIYTINDTDKKDETPRYIPAKDISLFTVGDFFETFDSNGSEDFRADYKTHFARHWHTFMNGKQALYNVGSQTLLKDL